jgi:prohibitin 2
VRESASSFSAEEINSLKRAELRTLIFDTLKTKFQDNGLLLADVQVRNITFSPEFIKAIEQRQVAQQDAERAVQEAEKLRTQAKGQADAVVLAAKGESDAVAQRAEGEATAIRIKAKADADALSLINEQITKNPLLIQYTYVQKLAQNVSLMLIPSNSPFLFDPAALLKASQSQNSQGSDAATPVPTAAAPTATPTPTK